MCDCSLLCQKGMTLCEPSATLPAFKVETLETLHYLIVKPHTKHQLYKVADNEHIPKIHCFPVLHDPGAEHFHEVGVAVTDCQRWEQTAHQHPSHSHVDLQTITRVNFTVYEKWTTSTCEQVCRRALRLGIHITVTNGIVDSSGN